MKPRHKRIAIIIAGVSAVASAAALVRVHELEELLVRARGFIKPEPAPSTC